MDAREADGMAEAAIAESGEELQAEATGEVTGFAGIIGRHPRMQAIFDVIRRVAPTDVTVLITGESGTGKELVAQAIHSQSRRRAQRLVPVHCGAIPEELLESEMFGHERGAFTGAVASRVGRFKLADGGTIFLDEIGDMSPKLQVKLLRVLEDGMFEPVGGVTTQQVDVRIVAATNRNLEEAVARAAVPRGPLLSPARRADRGAAAARASRGHPAAGRVLPEQLHTTKGLPRFEVTPEAMAVLHGATSGRATSASCKNLLEQLVVLGPADCVIRPENLPPKLHGRMARRRRERLDDAALGLRRSRHRLLPRDGVDRGSHHRAGARHQPRQQEGSRASPAAEPHDAAREAEAQARDRARDHWVGGGGRGASRSAADAAGASQLGSGGDGGGQALRA